MNFRKTIPFLVIAFSIGLCVSEAHATASTHLWAPSTDVQPFMKWHITSDVYLPFQTDTSGQPYPAITNVGLTVGVLPLEKINLEVGFDHKSGYGTFDRHPLYFNAKLGTPEGVFGKYVPALAVGIYDVGTKSYDKQSETGTNANVLYVKAAKTFNPIGRISLGYFSGNENILLDENGDKDNSGLLAAWERTLSKVSDNLWFCLEYMGSNSGYGTFHAGAAWKFADNAALLAACDVLNNRKLNLPDTFSLQMDIDFDFPCCKK